jgi:hypothetical protein
MERPPINWQRKTRYKVINVGVSATAVAACDSRKMEFGEVIALEPSIKAKKYFSFNLFQLILRKVIDRI